MKAAKPPAAKEAPPVELEELEAHLDRQRQRVRNRRLHQEPKRVAESIRTIVRDLSRRE